MSKCLVETCSTAKIMARGLCVTHYKRWYKGSLTDDIPIAARVVDTCSVSNCTRNVEFGNVCNSHYQRFLKHGSYQEDVPLKTPKVTGGRYIDKDGYVVVSAPIGLYVEGRNRASAVNIESAFEHQVVMAKHIGRPIKRGETVHHKNGIRTDNRIENLELWSGNHPRGSRVADHIKWAKEVLTTYGDDERLYET